MTTSRFETLQKAIQDYGAAAFENLIRCKALAKATVASLPEYLGCDADCVKAVPATGAFDPKEVYGDKAFSFSQRQVIALEPIQFGIALTVKNKEDSGSIWLRTTVTLELTGGTFDVFVAQRPVIRIPVEFSEELDPVLEAIYDEFIDTFQVRVLAFNDKRFETGIGFVP